MSNPDIDFMRLALEQAHQAFAADEVPIGAVLVDHTTGRVISQTRNQTREQYDPTAHAEVLAIRDGCRDARAQRIPECDLYVTLEPCPMCAAAISFARIRRVVYGADDAKSGGLSPDGPCLYSHSQLHHKPDVTAGVLAAESTALLQRFFHLKRQKSKDTA